MTNIDPLLTLSLAVHNNKGAYALLLGSGMSRAAGVPTGWEVVEDLVRRVAVLEGADAGTDPTAWYRSRHGLEPNYSELLETLAATPAERRELLRRYFEPTPEEREVGLKLPTPAHRAVARLVDGGYFPVIITTNFDRLLEAALRDTGVTPAVIATPDAVRGAVPLQHERVTVIKLHGDYLDTRIKNTPQELGRYDRRLNRLLDRVLDEYGLVVCGWSGVWDTALRAAIERCPSRRFTTFWMTKGAMTSDAERLVAHRQARVVEIESADAFFEALKEKVESLDELARPQPPSTAVAVATAKRYLASPEHRIRLHDLVMNEVELLRQRTLDIVPTDSPTNELFVATIRRLEEASETAMALLANGAYWGGTEHRTLWFKAITRLAQNDYGNSAQYDVWRSLRRYPAQLALYAAGLGATSAGNEDLLADLLLVPRLRAVSGADESPAVALHQYAVVEHDNAKLLFGTNGRKTPMSDHLSEVLRDALRETVPDDATYEDGFDKFEYVTMLAYAGVKDAAKERIRDWGPVGRFSWRAMYRYGRETVGRRIEAEISREGIQWPLLRHGLFDGSPERLLAAKAELDELAARWVF